MERELELEKLEDVKVSFGKNAFSPKVMYCEECNLKMEKEIIELSISSDIKIKLNIFKCPKCGEESLGLDEAKKLDRVLVMNRILSCDNYFSLKRKLSFDGESYIFRFPSDLIKGKKPNEVTIIPLESKEALIRW